MIIFFVRQFIFFHFAPRTHCLDFIPGGAGGRPPAFTNTVFKSNGEQISERVDAMQLVEKESTTGFDR